MFCILLAQVVFPLLFFLIQMQHTSPTVMPSAMRKIIWCLCPKAFNSSQPVVFSLCWHGNGSDFLIEKKCPQINLALKVVLFTCVITAQAKAICYLFDEGFITLLLKNGSAFRMNYFLFNIYYTESMNLYHHVHNTY